MKHLTASLRELLLDDKIISLLDQYKNHDGYSIGPGDSDVEDVTESYKLVRQLLINSIDNGNYDLLPYNRRKNIIEQYVKAEQSNITVVSFLTNIDMFCDVVYSSGLINSQIDRQPFTSEYLNIIQYQKNTESTLRYFEDKKKQLDELFSSYNEVKITLREIGKEREYIDNINVAVNTIRSNIQIEATQATELLNSIKEVERDIETKRLSIDTFATNIFEYKESIGELAFQAKEIIAMKKSADDLIKQAETALGLKSAEGVSAAFSSQYEAAKEGKWVWFVAAGLFLIASGAATVWILTGWGIEKPDEMSTIIGRIVAVGIMISGATFCASQYTRQIRIADDYAYKAVLAKSILAFSDEIKKRHDSQISTYLTKVLNEIHKDPQRSRSTKSTNENKINVNSLFDKVIDKIPSFKE